MAKDPSIQPKRNAALAVGIAAVGIILARQATRRAGKAALSTSPLGKGTDS